jgi:hypothetical protein
VALTTFNSFDTADARLITKSMRANWAEFISFHVRGFLADAELRPSESLTRVRFLSTLSDPIGPNVPRSRHFSLKQTTALSRSLL